MKLRSKLTLKLKCTYNFIFNVIYVINSQIPLLDINKVSIRFSHLKCII